MIYTVIVLISAVVLYTLQLKSVKSLLYKLESPGYFKAKLTVPAVRSGSRLKGVPLSASGKRVWKGEAVAVEQGSLVGVYGPVLQKETKSVGLWPCTEGLYTQREESQRDMYSKQSVSKSKYQ